MISRPTRSEIRALENRYPMPKNRNGLRKVFEEVFISGGGQDQESNARRVLEDTLNMYRPSSGWYVGEEPDSKGVFFESGRWYAYCHRAKYE